MSFLSNFLIVILMITFEAVNVTNQISEVELICHVPSLIAILEEVIVSATISKPLFQARFAWDFGDGTGNLWTTIITSNGTYSKASHKYGIAGDYVVRVNVSNALVSSDVVSVRLPNVVTVVEPIREVYLKPLYGSFVIGLHEKSEGSRTSSDPVVFEARTHHGSHVEFHFDYGDGTKETIMGEFDDIMSMPYAHGTHVYQNVGSYVVSVTARNPLGNRSRLLTELFRVQFVPKDLKFERNYYVASRGNVTSFRVIVSVGTNVTYDWQFGNGVVLLNAGPSVDYAFPAIGSYKITVTAHNDATRQWSKTQGTTTSALVYVLDVLQGVKLDLAVANNETRSKPMDRLVFATDESVEFVASLKPVSSNHFGVVYVWTWGSSVDRQRRTLIGRMKQTFSQDGRYSLSVMANNSISQVTSTKLVFDVVQKLDKIGRIQHPGSIVLGEIAAFEAQHWFGSNVTFVWNFGDGSEPMTRVSARRATHTYKRLGEFLVTVKLTNVLSSTNLSCIVFVLKQRCDKPELKILPGNDVIKIRQSGILRLEAEVAVRCSSSSRVSYSWNVSDLQTTFRRRILSLSASRLTLRNHTVNLKVAMENTIVYSFVSTLIEVVANPLEVTIFGGTSRSIGTTETLMLVGRSEELLAKKQGPVSTRRFYQWSCVPLESQQSDCFRNVRSENSLSDTQQFQLIGSFLNRDFKSFLFTLTMRQADSVATANQLIELNGNSMVLSVSVLCHTCLGFEVSKQRRVSLSAQCDNCVSNVTFVWQVWLVLDGNHNLPLSEHDCVNPDGSTFFLNASSKATENYDNLDSYGNASTIDSNALKNHKWTTEGQSTPKDANLSRGNLSESPPFLEGFPGELGSVPARRQMITGRFPAFGDELGSETSTSVSLPTKGTFDKVLDSRYVAPRIRHSFIREWKFVRLEVEDTATGFDQKEFVIKPDVLKVGRTYVIVVIAQMVNRDSGVIILQGKATQEVKVSMGPINGRCSLMPVSGSEYETPFKLDCFEWKATDDETVFYELSYSLSAYHSSVLIYYGVDANFKFVLPSGFESENHEIRLNVVVRQESGSATVVCSITRTVLPLTNSSFTRLLSRELTSSSQSKISQDLKRGDVGSTLNRIHVIASMLNEDYFANKSFIEYSKQTFYRTRLLKFLSKIELQTEAEALQLLQAVEEIYKNLELVDESLLQSSAKAVRRAARFWWSFNTCGAFCESGLELLVKIVGSLVVRHHTTSSLSNVNVESLVPMLILVQKAVAVRLSSRLLDEKPLTITSEQLFVEASCVWTVNRTLQLRWDNLEVSLVRLPLDSALCIQAITTVLLETIEMSVYTSMISLEFSSFDTGFLLLNANSSFVGKVTFDLSTYSDLRSRSSLRHDVFATKRQLTTDLMDVYEFHVANLERNTFLSVVFGFEASDIRSVLILVSNVQPPSLKNSFHRQRFAAPFNDHYTFSFLSKNLNGAGKYFIAVLDADYDTRRSNSKSEKDLFYSVNVSRVDCLQWNMNEAAWSGSECKAVTSLRSNRCRCGVSSSYTLKRTPITLTFRTTTFDHMLRSSLNLLIPTVLFILVGFYSCLLIVSYNKSRNEVISHFCGRIFLSDNSKTDRYAYEVTLQTGHVIDAGTTAKVYIVLHGVNGITEPRELVAVDSENIFHCGSTNTFLLTSPSNLGRIWKIHIWHDNYGENPSWFLSYAVVKSLSTGEKFYYDCNKWFAVEGDDCKIEREILLKETSWKFCEIFFSRFWFYRCFTSWSFVLSFSRYGHFTQNERILCSFLGTLVCSFFAAAWCFENSAKFVTFFEVRQPSYELLVVSFVLSQIGYAAQTIPAVLFHYTKLMSCKTNETSTLKELSKEQEAVAANNKNITFSNLRFVVDEPIEKWQTLQNWAEKQWSKYLDRLSEDVDSMSVGTDAFVSGSESTANITRTLENDRNRRIFGLPVAFRFGLWCFYALSIVATSVVTTLFAIRFPFDLSIIWLQLLIMSFTFSYFVITPIMSFIAALFVATQRLILGKLYPDVRSCCCRCGDESLAFDTDSTDRPSSECDFRRKVTALQRSRQLRFSRPPAENRLIANRNSTLQKKKVSSYFYELFSAFFVFAVIFGCILTQGNSTVYQLNKQLNKSFTNGKTIPLSSISSVKTWNRWMKEEFLSDAFEISEEVSFVKRTSSVILNGMKLIVEGGVDDTTTKTHLLPKERKSILQLIDTGYGLDNNTKRISLEFVLYNIPTKLFSSVKLMSDFSASSKALVDSVILSADDWPFNLFSSLLKVLLFLIFFYVLNSMFEKCLPRTQNIAPFWKVCKFLFVVLLMIYLLIYLFYGYVSRTIIADFESKRNVDIFLAVYLNFICSGILGLLMSIHLVSSLRLLRIEFVFVRLGGFLRAAIKTLVSMTIGFFVLMISFSFYGFLWKFNGNWNFQTFFGVFESLFNIVMRSYDFKSVGDNGGLVFQVYVYFFVASLILFFTIAMKFVIKARVVSSSRSHVLNVTIDDFIGMFRKQKPAEKFEKTEEIKTDISIEFILAELEFQIEEMLFRTTQLCKYDGVDFSDTDASQLNSESSQFTSVDDVQDLNEAVDETTIGFVNQFLNDGDLIGSTSSDEDRAVERRLSSSPSNSSIDIVLLNAVASKPRLDRCDNLTPKVILANHCSDKRFNSCHKLRRSKTRGKGNMLSDLEADIRKAVESMDVL